MGGRDKRNISGREVNQQTRKEWGVRCMFEEEGRWREEDVQGRKKVGRGVGRSDNGNGWI